MANGQETMQAAILINARMNTRDFEQGAQRIRQEVNQLQERTERCSVSLQTVSSALDAAGDRWLNAGRTLQRVSDRLMPLVELYADFDDTMRATQGKLVTATTEDMEQLEEAVRTWAEETRFGAVETAEAVKEAASAGWELSEIYEGMPTVMTLAATASIDLQDAMEYLNSALSGMDLEFDQSEKLVDQWVMAANRSRASVTDLGEAMQRMGSLMTFMESSDEVLTLLSVMAEYGTKGTEAGTLLRNVMIRLIAPTQKATETMEALGATEEELEEVAGMDLEATAEAIDKLGMSAYDSEGNLKSIVQIVNELREATAGMTEEEMYQSLAAIFPTRTLRGIMDLLRTSEEEYAAIQERILGSTGYATNVAELQEGGIGGALRELESRVEEFKLVFGEAMAPGVESAADALGNLIGKISDIPQGVWDAIGEVGAVIIEAAPAMMGIGLALKVAGKLLTPSGAIVTGIAAIVGLIGVIERGQERGIQEALEETFGNVTLDVSEMQQAIDAANSSVSDQKTAVNELVESIRADGDVYVAALSEMTEKLTTWTITGQTLTEEQQEALMDLGAQMVSTVGRGIEDSELAHLNMLDLLFGTDKEDRGIFSSAVLTANDYYEDLYAEWRQVGDDLTSALTEALLDGEITPEEEAGIQAQIEKLSEIQRRIQEGVQNEEYAKAIYNASNVTADSWDEFLTSNEASRQAAIAALEEEYGTIAGTQGAAYMRKIEEAENEEEKARIQKEWDEFNEGLYKKQTAETEELTAQYQELALQAIRSVFKESGLSEELIDLALGLDEEFAYRNLDEIWGNERSYYYKSGAVQGYSGDMQEDLLKFLSADTDMGNALTKMMQGGGMERLAAFLGVLSEEASIKNAGPFPILKWLGNLSGEGNTGVESNLPEDAEVLARRGGVTIWRKKSEEIKSSQEDVEAAFDGYIESVGNKAEELGENAGKRLVNGIQSGLGSISFSGGGGSTGGSGSGRNSILSKLGFAEGGRATQASIFGEAGPEWAIPEEHSMRTFSLLKAAAQASGFTVASSGQTSASSGGAATIIYSPVINAQDARGVESALRDDKTRLEKWWRERAARAEAEAFA